MLMKATPQQVEKLLKGNHNFSQFGFSMMMTRLKGDYAKDASPATVQHATSEVNKFLAKFSSIMAADFAVIQKL